MGTRRPTGRGGARLVRCTAAAALAVVALAGTGCSVEGRASAGTAAPIPSTRITNPPRIIDAMAVTRARGRVGIVGDSITDLSRPWVNRRLDDGWDVVVTAHSGDRFADQLPWAKALVSDRPDAVIIELGTNDAAKANPNAIRDLGRMVEVVRHVPCVIWYTVSVYGSATGLRALRINQELRAVVAAHDNFHLTDWGTASSKPGLLNPRDGIHPTWAGRDLLTTMYRNDLIERCGLDPVR